MPQGVRCVSTMSYELEEFAKKWEELFYRLLLNTQFRIFFSCYYV